MAAPRPVLLIFGAAVRPNGAPSLTLRRRVDAALAFGRTLRRPLYLPSGGVGRFGAAEAAVMAALLRSGGVEEADILRDETARDTLDTVRACVGLRRAAAEVWAPVYAVSSAYHLPRCLLLMRLAGLPARAAPPPPFPASRRWRKRWYWRLREVPALPWDALLLAIALLTKRRTR